MPWEKGHPFYPGAGNPGYEITSVRLRKMEDLLDKYLLLVEKVLDDKGKEKDIKKITLLSQDMRKILDKLHATKYDEEHRFGLSDNLMQLLYGGNYTRNIKTIQAEPEK